MRVAAIVPAAGRGRRIGTKLEKPYIELCGKPILAHTLLKLSTNRHIAEIVVAVNSRKRNTVINKIVHRFGIRKVKVVNGGRKRKDSVFNALRNISIRTNYVLVHDCVRPFINDELIDSSLRAAQRFGACVVAVPVKSSLKYIRKDGFIQYTPDRRNFWEAQTPQVFRRDLIEKAYAKGKNRPNITDDSMLVEGIGVRPKVLLGSYSNIKITTREDLELAKILLDSRFSVIP